MPSAVPRIAVVLAGGGARGAYEVGVLYYIHEKLPALLGRPIRFDIVVGSSVGAIHGCYLAARAGDPGMLQGLARIWRAFDGGSVYRVRPVDALAMPFKFLGFRGRSQPVEAGVARAPRLIPGLFDIAPLERLVLDRIPWSRISENVSAGRIEALAIAATEIKSGHTIIFVENREGNVDRWARDPFVIARHAHIRPEHALASAAIPFFFPAIEVDGSFYCDGSLRLNTPLSPALRLGADRVLVIGVRHHPSPGAPEKTVPESSAASPAFLAGKVLNALLLDRIDYDFNRLRLFNAILEEGRRTYGEEFLERINQPIVRERGVPYRIVRDFFIQPSEDLGVVASNCLARHAAGRTGSWLSRLFLRLAARNTGGEADLLSYLFFDGCYAGHLIELGISDAEARRDELAAFFAGG